jgi:hypothetical protein
MSVAIIIMLCCIRVYLRIVPKLGRGSSFGNAELVRGMFTRKLRLENFVYPEHSVNQLTL